MKKNILHICLTDSWGGLEMAVLKWSQILRENGHDNLSIGAPGSTLVKNLRHFEFKTLEWGSAHYWAPRFSFKLRKLVQEKKIDTVILQNLRDLWIVSPALMGLKQINLIGFSQMLIGVKKRDLLHHFIYKRLDHLLTLTDWQQQALAPYLPVSPSTYKTIPNFVDSKLFTPQWRSSDFRQQMGFAEDDFVIGIIGRIDEQKGQKELLQAFKRLAQDQKKVQLLIVGDPTRNEPAQESYYKQLKTFTEQNGLQHQVHFRGFQNETHQLYANMDLFVLASYQETFGFVVVEAMASGTPVLGTQAGGVPEILNHGDFGFLCQPQDAESLYQQLKIIVESPQQRKEKAQKALTRAREFYDRQKVYERFAKYL